MSQFYSRPSSVYPPQQNPESEYYDENDYEYVEEDDGSEDTKTSDSLAQRALIFFAGGCVVFLCMSCCALVGAGLWYADVGSGFLAATPAPGSDLGLALEEPAFPDESVVNEQNVKLTLLDVNRNAALDTVPPTEGRELIIVTVELLNQGDADVDYNERNFTLVNANEDAYTPTPGAIEGSLGRGSLPPGEGLEGRLVFEVAAGDSNLVLKWEGGRNTEPRYISLE